MTRSGVKYLVTIHKTEPNKGESLILHRWFEREARAADGVIVLSELVRRQLLARVPDIEAPVLVVPHGPLGHHEGDGRRGRDDRSRFVPPRRLLFFGRVLPYQELHLLLEAFGCLRNSYPDLTLTIAGSGSLKPYAPAAGQPGLRVDNRSFDESEIPGIFAAADLVVLPSLEACQSGVMAVAQGMGVPVVATSAAGLPEHVRYLGNSLASDDIPAAAIERAIRSLLDAPELYAQCLSGSREVTGNHWNDSAEEIVNFARRQLEQIPSRLSRSAPVIC